MSERELRRREPKEPVPEPQRLLHDREMGRLLSSASAAYRAGLDESAAFQRLSKRLEAPERRTLWRALTLGAAFSAAAAVVMVLGVFDEAPSRVALSPETTSTRRAARAGQASVATVEERETQTANAVSGEGAPAEGAERPTQQQAARSEARPADGEAQALPTVAAPELPARSEPERAGRDERSQNDGERAGKRRSDGSSLHELPGSVQPSASGAAVRATTADRAAASGGLPGQSSETPSIASRRLEARLDCSNLLEKDARAAEHCYAQRAAESSGLSAEAALYELARLRRDVQQDAEGALAALNEYRERFPRGSLRNEVGLSRVELLSQLGRSREALSEAEALLGSAKERAAELYLLRGDIFRRNFADFARAAEEYSKAERFGGGFGAEATRRRGLSLEALGDVPGALEAYRRYASGPEQPRKADVNRRIEALTSSQRGTTP